MGVYALILLKKQAKKYLFLKVHYVVSFSAGFTPGKNAIPPMRTLVCRNIYIRWDTEMYPRGNFGATSAIIAMVGIIYPPLPGWNRVRGRL